MKKPRVVLTFWRRYNEGVYAIPTRESYFMLRVYFGNFRLTAVKIGENR